MVQLVPINIDKLGAASAMSGSKRYELADNMQVYLWYKGQYYATTLSQVNAEDYHLIGWYDSLGCAAGGKDPRAHRREERLNQINKAAGIRLSPDTRCCFMVQGIYWAFPFS